MSFDTAVRVVRASSLAELSWTDATGVPNVCGVVALVWQDTPAIAFTYAAADRAHQIGGAPTVALTLTDPRSTAEAFAASIIRGRPRLVEDLHGTQFAEQMLEQELRRYPPARRYADSPMLLREHWWYQPRLILTIDVDEVRPLPARAEPADHLLVVAEPNRTNVHSVRVAPKRTGPSTIAFEPLGADVPSSGPAVLFGQDASFPDLEQWTTWSFRGRCGDGRFAVGEEPGRTGLNPVPSVWQRIRRESAFARACRAGIERAERARG